LLIPPLATLESYFEALNVKKFDGENMSFTVLVSIVRFAIQFTMMMFGCFSVAFAVDPLYHQTSAQFNEGGAKGLLLNNLGVYGGCRVLFDSQEVPVKCLSCENQHEGLDTIDLSFARGLLD
jgi:condensin complex subunit 2